MFCQTGFDQWQTTIMHHLTHLSKPQATVLALRSFGMVLARSCALTAVRSLLAVGRQRKEDPVRQPLRAWYDDVKRKRGPKRQILHVEICFAPCWADHYPQRFSKRLATRQPSTSNVKSRRPRHKVYRPGIPSLVRFR